MTDFPALFDDARGTAHPLAGRTEFLVGRTPDADLPVTELSCSRRQFRLVAEAGRWYVEALSETNPTYLNGLSVAGRTELAHGGVIWVGDRRFRYLERADAPAVIEPASATVVSTPALGKSPGSGRDVTVVAAGAVDGPVVGPKGAFPLDGVVLIGREAGQAQLVLPHAHVSRVHAQVIATGGRSATVTDLRSANGTFVNGRRVTAATQLRPGDRIDVGPYSLAYTGTALVPQSRADNVELIGRDLSRSVTDSRTGDRRVLIDGVTLVVRPWEFVCVLGPSGSGKSTLLSALSARVPADGGQVLINGKDLYANFPALKQDMIVVPQKDVLHETLTVEQSLWYTARLRLPPDTAENEVRTGIDSILATVGMSAHRHKPIRNLSGGQVKRASLANELLGKPTLVFLDEVTSGLDEQTDREMMALFRSLADGGKTVVCVTHALANVERYCQLVAVLAEGGRLAFFGPPAEAAKYFGVARLGDVYEQLAAKPAAEWKERFAASPYYSRYIDARLPADPDADPEPFVPITPPFGERVREAYRQAGLLFRRNMAVLAGDRRALGLTAAQALVVAFLVAILFGDLEAVSNVFERGRRTGVLTFLLTVSCFWFGCNNAAKEFVKERFVYRRERDFNLGVGSYYAAKFAVLVSASWVQTIVVWVTVAWLCRPADPFVGTAVFLLALSAAGVGLGLAISAAAGTEDTAVTAIPLALLPQIILADAVAPLSGMAKALGQLGVTSYWGVRGLNAMLPEDTARAAGVDQGGAFWPLVMVLVHTAAYVAVGVGVLTIQARRELRFDRAVASWLREARRQWDERVNRLNKPGKATDGESAANGSKI